MLGGRRVAVLCWLAFVPALTGCAAEGSASPGADRFARKHAASAAVAAGAMRSFETALARLERKPTAAVLAQTSLAARRAKRRVAPATEWEITENGEEENLGQAQIEINEGADAFLAVIDALRAAQRVPSREAIAGYRARITRGREQWNEGTRQVWYLAHVADPPSV